MDQKTSRLLALRIGLGLLIIANIIMIFLFSAQNGELSGNTSRGVTYFLAKLFVHDYDLLSAREQTEIIQSIHPFVRKLAHMTEFGLLGAFTFSLLLTWKGRIRFQYAGALLFVLLIACLDEIGQSCSYGRASQLSDVFIDLLGAILACSAILLLIHLIRRHQRKKQRQMKGTNV